MIKPIFILSFFCISSFGKLTIGAYQNANLKEFVSSKFGELVLDYINNELNMHDASFFSVEKQVVAGMNYKVVLADHDKTLYLLKFFVPPGGKAVHELSNFHIKKTSKPDQSLVNDELKEEVKSVLLNYFKEKFSQDSLKFLSFSEFNVHQFDDNANIIHCKSKINDSTNAINVVESFLVQKGHIVAEAFMHTLHSPSKTSNNICRGYEDSMLKCLYSEECIPDSVLEFGGCIIQKKEEL